MNEPESPPELRDPTLLFEEYLRAWDTGQSVDLVDLCARAGPREADLKKRIEIFRTLQELSDTLDTATDGASVPVDIAKIGRFERLVRIGQGGLSQVFLAHDPSLKRDVALKILSPDQITTSDARGWIASEAQSLARLDHPGVVRVFEVDEADGFAYVAMEFLAGPSLAVVIDRIRTGVPSENPAVEAATARLSTVAARCRLVLQLARALAYCHEQGIVHRDIKPGNILLQANGEPKWIDFGLAHIESDSASLTQVTQRLMGTPAYIAPEQVDDGRTGASPLSDQFSLGIVLYELLTSRNAFMRSSRSATLDAISRAEPPSPRKTDPSIPVDVERICLHALERVPEARYASMAKMADDIEAFLEHRPISLRAPTPVQRFALWSRRHQREIAISTKAIGFALVVAIGIWIVGAMRERSSMRSKLAEFESSVDRLTAPQDFVERFDLLDADRSRASAFDRSLAGGVLGADIAQVAERAIERTSLRMSTVLKEEWSQLDPTRTTDPIQASRRLLLQWREALDAEAKACPECTVNRRDRERGIVDLPVLAGGELRLWQYTEGPSPITPNLRSIDPNHRRAAGLYRLQTFDSARCLAAECELLVSAEQERRTLTPRPLHLAIAARMIDVGRTTLSTDGAGNVDVAAHRIMRDPIRWSDLQFAGWSEEQCAGIKAFAEYFTKREHGWNEPATLEWNVALELAGALGARLASGSELASALHDSRIEFPGRDTDVLGELISSTVSTNDEVFVLHYDGSPRSYRTRAVLVDSITAVRPKFVTFRLARSSPD